MHFEFFGPAPPPDHPRYKSRYGHFSHPSCPKVAAFISDDTTNDTESTIDATNVTEPIVLDDKTVRKSDDDDDLEFYLYKGPSAPFTLRKFPRDINNNATTANEAKPAMNGAMSTIDPIILPPIIPFRNQPTTHEQFLRFEELVVSDLIPHDSTYDDDSIDSDLDYFQDEGNDYERVNSYDFVHTDRPFYTNGHPSRT